MTVAHQTDPVVTTSTNSMGHFLRQFMLVPVLAQRTVLLGVACSLIFLSITQGIVLLLIKGFLAAFFVSSATQDIELFSLIPEAVRHHVPLSWNMMINRQSLSALVPFGIVVAGLLKAIATYLYNVGLAKLSLKVAQHYRETVFHGILSIPWLSSAKRSAGEWMSVIMADAIFIQSRLIDFSTAFVKDGVLIISCLITLAIIYWPAAVVLLLIAPMIGWSMGRAGKRIAWYTEAFQRELGLLAGRILGIRERYRFMKAQQGERFEQEHFDRGNQAYLKMMSGSIFLRAIVAPGMEWVGFAIFALFIFGWTRKLPGFTFSPDVAIQFFVSLGLILRPVREMGEQVARWSETVGGLKRSMAVMEEVMQGATQNKLPPSKMIDHRLNSVQSIEIAKIHIKYSHADALVGHDLKLRSRKALAVIGPSGSGKSTILKSLAGLVRPYEWQGSRSWNEVVQLTTLVSQTPFLFKDTIRSNLLYGLPKELVEVTTDEMLWAAMRVVNLEQAMRALPHGLASPFNPVQTNLSGGQIQRLVIARAILRRPLILMLDEATAAIDGATEYDISKRLIDTVHETGTILLTVTHRLRWLELYDEVWFVEHGKIQFKGSHDQLLDHPRYRDFTSSLEGSTN